MAGLFMLAKAQGRPGLIPPRLPKGKVPAWMYHPIDIAGIAIIFTVFFALILLSFTVDSDPNESFTAEALIFNIGFQLFLVAIAAAFALQRCSLTTWLGLKWSSWPWVFLIAPTCVFLMWLLFFLIDLSGYMDWMESLGVEQLQDTVQVLQESDNPVIIILMVITAVFVAPICEEIVFRGYLYPVLKKFVGLGPALILSSIVFSAAHGHLAVLLPLFILGALLVLIYEYTGSIWAPIAVHFCFNGATVSLQLIARVFDLQLDV